MTRPGLKSWLTRLAWGLLAFNLILIFVVPTAITPENLLFVIVYLVWLMLTLVIATTCLIVRYQWIFRTWPGWTVFPAFLTLSSLVVQDILPVHHPNLAFAFSMLFITSAWGVGVATAVLLWHRDVGLGMIAWGLAILVWALLLSWRLQGSLIDMMVSKLIRPDEPSPLWWYNSSVCIFVWIIPLGIIGFLGHTIRLILQEFRDEKHVGE